MNNTSGAPARQSSTLENLDRFGPSGNTALAAVGLALLDAINTGALTVNDQAEPAQAKRARALVETLYPLQDCLHGSETGLPEALAAMLHAAEGMPAAPDGPAHEVPLYSAVVRPAVAFSVPVELPADEALEMAAMILEYAIATTENPATVVSERQVRTVKAFVDQAILELARTSATSSDMSLPAKGGAQ
ncbi:hypothetical protein [Candidatus Accumulibacter sp. ACC007]|uniref:hypothetical protein n=1 Tax=Candidatus Accumulibacter sp. ACC007 TaxID=2823333 RepID=UPI0025C34155|nr:hypothetical protein [Candidatus Accumulibacter sp. ACC007]